MQREVKSDEYPENQWIDGLKREAGLTPYNQPNAADSLDEARSPLILVVIRLYFALSFN